MKSIQTINSIFDLPSVGILFPQFVVTDGPNQKPTAQKPTDSYKDRKPRKTSAFSRR